MTREEAIIEMQRMKKAYCNTHTDAQIKKDSKIIDALDIGIKALEQALCEDDNKELITLWHTITGYNKNLSYDANRDDGVDLPEVSRNVLVIYPGIEGVYVKISSEEGMTGTSYYDGTKWAYFEKQMESEDKE
jgi:hypothetical protein